ncbi:glycosyltransferase family 2 protein [uncultured Roseibium sp.]|uniref:glycosyltransferase family 2 protein n=1 Tax=uncultured Roseibium sp. TaxID=1936171 RepID=UPI003216F34B
METVSISIASIGRPSLADTLHSLSRLPKTEDLKLDVLIADDSRDGAATRLVESLDLNGLPVTCLPVASGNISHARNALLDAAESDWIVFVDDDEWVEPDWLARMFAAQRDFQADVVIGPVLPAYPPDTPAWLVRANPLYKDWGHRGKRLDTGRGGNTLVRMRLIRELALRFDPAYGITGGEDTVFFAEAASRGAVIVATDDAIIREHVPPERLSPTIILRRAIRAGQSYGILQQTHLPSAAARLLFLLDAAAKTGLAAFLSLMFRPIDRARHFRMRQKLARNLGKLRSAFDLPLPEVYKKPDRG